MGSASGAETWLQGVLNDKLSWPDAGPSSLSCHPEPADGNVFDEGGWTRDLDYAFSVIDMNPAA